MNSISKRIIKFPLDNISLKILNNYQNIIFDLDNTLYDETIYLLSAYKEISSFVSKTKGINADNVLNYLVCEFEKEGRKNLFNKLLDYFSLDNFNLTTCLKIIRTHKIGLKIPLYESMNNLIVDANRKGKFLSILTNGNKQQQLNKINQINWPIPLSNFHILFANEFEPKPSNKAVLYLFENCNLNCEDTIMIGDNIVDKICAKSSGIDFIEIQSIINVHLTEFKKFLNREFY